jgi:outer membrane protein assembly factor BamE (lipoprotein component of BamABCDE complex)
MGLLRHSLALFAIWCISWIVGGLSGPVDPISSFYFTLMIFPVAVLSYGFAVFVLVRSIPKREQRPRTRALWVVLFAVLSASIILADLESSRVFNAQRGANADVVTTAKQESRLEDVRARLRGTSRPDVLLLLGEPGLRFELGEGEWHYFEQSPKQHITDIDWKQHKLVVEFNQNGEVADVYINK